MDQGAGLSRRIRAKQAIYLLALAAFLAGSFLADDAFGERVAVFLAAFFVVFLVAISVAPHLRAPGLVSMRFPMGTQGGETRRKRSEQTLASPKAPVNGASSFRLSSRIEQFFPKRVKVSSVRKSLSPRLCRGANCGWSSYRAPNGPRLNRIQRCRRAPTRPSRSLLTRSLRS